MFSNHSENFILFSEYSSDLGSCRFRALYPSQELYLLYKIVRVDFGDFLFCVFKLIIKLLKSTYYL
jgi:hypothetical protein